MPEETTAEFPQLMPPRPLPVSDPRAIADNQRSANENARDWLTTQAYETASRAARTASGGEAVEQFDQTWDQVRSQLRQEHPNAQLNPLAAEEAYRQVRDNSFRSELLGQKPDEDKYNNVRYWVNRLPVMGHVFEFAENRQDTAALQRIRDGGATQGDYLRLGQSMAYQDMMTQRTGRGQQITDVATSIPGFAAEMFLAAPVGTAARTATAARIGGALGMTAEAVQASKLLGAFPRLAQGVAMTGPMAANLTQAVSERMVPEVRFHENGQIEVGPDKDFRTAAWQGYLDTQIEIFSELAGGQLTRRAGNLFGMIPGSTRARMATAGLAKWWQRTTGGTPAMVQDFFKASGFHGVFGEFLEERLGEGARNLAQYVGGEQQGRSMAGNVMAGRFSEALDQLIVEGAAFYAYGKTTSILGNLARRAQQFGMPQGGPPLRSAPEVGEFARAAMSQEERDRHDTHANAIYWGNVQTLDRWSRNASLDVLEQHQDIYPTLRPIIEARRAGVPAGEIKEVQKFARETARQAAEEGFGTPIPTPVIGLQGPQSPQTANVAPETAPQQGPPVAPGGVQTGNEQTSTEDIQSRLQSGTGPRTGLPTAYNPVRAPFNGPESEYKGLRDADKAYLASTVPQAHLDVFKQNLAQMIQNKKASTFVGPDGHFDMHKMAAYEFLASQQGYIFGLPTTAKGVIEWPLLRVKTPPMAPYSPPAQTSTKPAPEASTSGPAPQTGKTDMKKFMREAADEFDAYYGPDSEFAKRQAGAVEKPIERRKGDRSFSIGENRTLTGNEQGLNPAAKHAIFNQRKQVVRVDLNDPSGKSFGYADLSDDGRDTIHVEWMGRHGAAGGEGQGRWEMGPKEILKLLRMGANEPNFKDFKKVTYINSAGRNNAGEKVEIDLDRFRKQQGEINDLEKQLQRDAREEGVEDSQVQRDLGEAERGAPETARNRGGDSGSGQADAGTPTEGGAAPKGTSGLQGGVTIPWAVGSAMPSPPPPIPLNKKEQAKVNAKKLNDIQREYIRTVLEGRKVGAEPLFDWFEKAGIHESSLRKLGIDVDKYKKTLPPKTIRRKGTIRMDQFVMGGEIRALLGMGEVDPNRPGITDVEKVMDALEQNQMLNMGKWIIHDQKQLEADLKQFREWAVKKTQEDNPHASESDVRQAIERFIEQHQAEDSAAGRDEGGSRPLNEILSDAARDAAEQRIVEEEYSQLMDEWTQVGDFDPNAIEGGNYPIVQPRLFDLGQKTGRKKTLKPGSIRAAVNIAVAEGRLPTGREVYDTPPSLFEGAEPIAPTQKAQMKRGPRPGTAAAMFPEAGGNPHFSNARKIHAYEQHGIPFIQKVINAIKGVSGTEKSHEELFEALKEKAGQESLNRGHEPGTAYGVGWDIVEDALGKMAEQQNEGSMTLDQFKRFLVAIPNLQSKITANGAARAAFKEDVPVEALRASDLASEARPKNGLQNIAGIRAIAAQITQDLKQIDDVSELMQNIAKAGPAMERQWGPARGKALRKFLTDNAWAIKRKGAGAVDKVEDLILQYVTRGAEPSREALANEPGKTLKDLINQTREAWDSDDYESILAIRELAERLYPENYREVEEMIDEGVLDETPTQELLDRITEHFEGVQPLASMGHHVDRPVQWIKKTRDRWTARLSNGGVFEAAAVDSGSDDWEIAFTNERGVGQGMTGLEGTRATRVLRDVSAALVDFARTAQPTRMLFTGWGDSRLKLYHRLAQEAADGLGYDLIAKKRSFELVKNIQKQEALRQQGDLANESVGKPAAALAEPMSPTETKDREGKFPTVYSILALMERLFNVGTSYASLPGRIQAQYRDVPERIVKEGMVAGDLKVGMEELAHHIDNKLGLLYARRTTKGAGSAKRYTFKDLGNSVAESEQIQKGFRKVAGLTGRSFANNHVYVQEGFAEMLRRFVMSEAVPVSADVLAAREWMLEQISKHPETQKHLWTIKEAFADFKGLNAVEQFAGQISPTGRPAEPYDLPTREKINDVASDAWVWFQDKILNDLAPAERFEKAAMSRGKAFGPGQRVSQIMAVLRYARQSWATQYKEEGIWAIVDGKQTRIGRPFKEIVAGLVQGEDLVKRADGATDFETFALARHIEDLANRIDEMPEEERKKQPVGQETLDRARAAMRQFRAEPRYERLTKAANLLTQANNDSLQALVEMGIMEQAKVDLIKTQNPVYASMRRVQDIEARRAGLGKTRGERVTAGVYKRFGGDQQFVSPIQSYFGRLNMVAQLQAEQMVRNAVADIAETPGMGPYIITVDQPKKMEHRKVDTAELAQRLDKLMGEPGMFDDIIEAAGDQLSFYFTVPTTEHGAPAYVVMKKGMGVEVKKGDKWFRVYSSLDPVKAQARLREEKQSGQARMVDAVVPQWYEVTDIPLHRMLTNESANWQLPPPVSLVGNIMKWATAITKHTATTLNPAFLAMNIPRDVQDFLRNVANLSSVKDLPEMLGRAYNFQFQILMGKEADQIGDELFRLYHYLGGELQKLVPFDFKGIVAQWEELTRQPGWQDKVGAWKDFGTQFLKVLGAGEYGPRVTAMRDYLAEHGWTEEKIKEARKANPGQEPVPWNIMVGAMDAAAEVTTPFGRGGSWTRYWNQHIPFLQASVAATDKLFRQGKANPTRMAAAVAIYMAIEVLHHLMMKDQDWYNEQEPHLRYRFWAFPTPLGLWRLPKPQGLMNGGSALVQELIRKTAGTDPRMADAMWQLTGEALPPYMPAAFQTPIDLLRGHDFAGRPIVPRGEEGAPGNAFRYQIPYALDRATGGYGGLARRGMEEVQAGRVPSPRNPFAVTSEPNASVDRLYERLKELGAERTRYRRLGQPFPGEAEYRRLDAAAERMAALRRAAGTDRSGLARRQIEVARAAAR